MKKRHLLLFYLIFTFNFCFSQSKATKLTDLQKKLEDSSKKSIANSPYRDSKFMTNNLSDHTNIIRDLYLMKVIELKDKYPKRNILIIESFDFPCQNCPPQYIEIYDGKNYSTYSIIHNGNFKLRKNNNTKIDSNLNADIIEIFKKDTLRSEKYRTNKYHKKKNTFYHLFYSSNKVESVYIKHWTDEKTITNHR